MYPDLKKMFLWPGMKNEVTEFVYAYLTYQKSSGMMQPLSIPEWKWDKISMDFVTNFTNTSKGFYSIWVIINRMTKLAYFILIKINYPLSKLTELYIERIVSLYDIQSSILSNRDLRFRSRFWQSLQEAMDTKLRLCSTYQPQKDGQTEKTIQSLENLLRACVLDQGVN